MKHLFAILMLCPLLVACGSEPVSGRVAKSEVERQAAEALAAKVGARPDQVPKIACPGELVASVGEQMSCRFGPTEDGKVGQILVIVNSVDGNQVSFQVETVAKE